MRELNEHDVQRIRRSLPKTVLQVMRRDLGRPFLAGGFIRAIIAGEEPNDIDLFCANKDDAMSVAKQIESLVGTDARVIDTDNAVTVLGMKYPVQIIHRWTFNSPNECVESFDFTIACAAVWRTVAIGFGTESKWCSCCDDLFYEDLAAKRLTYRNPVSNEDAGGSLLRMLKFSRSGYSGPLRTVADVVDRLNSGVNEERLREGMPRRDVYLGLLREVDTSIADIDRDKDD